MAITDEQAKRIEAHRLADEAWDAAWDAARDEDAKAGRPYDRRVYTEKAHAARMAVLAAHPHVHAQGRACS